MAPLKNVHTLKSIPDLWFLMQKRRDPYVFSQFRSGDRVVVCKGCRQVFLAMCWEETGNVCPMCGNRKTLPFSKNAFYFTRRRSSGIVIHNHALSVPVFDLIGRWLSENILTDLSDLLVMLLPFVLICQIVASTLLHYPFFQLPDTVSKVTYSIQSAGEHIRSSAEDTWVDLDYLGQWIAASGKDTVKKLRYSVSRPLGDYIPKLKGKEGFSP